MSMSTVDDFVEGSSSNASGRKEKGSLRKTREELNDIEKQRTKRINQHMYDSYLVILLFHDVLDLCFCLM